MKENKRFSIIIPVYNAEKYLDTCISGLLNQTLSFEEYVELILVNDGSKDNSKEVCEKYVEKYPDNVVYVEQENAGPSAARNKGLEMATGDIVGFLDSDDKYSIKTLAMINYYFNIVHDFVDVAVIPVQQFGAKTDGYYLNGKFWRGVRTIDLKEANWFDVCMRVGQAFIRREAAQRHQFDSSITFFEDSKYINEVIREKMRIGVVNKCYYYYRRYPSEADANTSLTVGAETNTRLYLETPVQVVLHFLEQYENKEDIPMYFQYLALCEMRWRIFYTTNCTSEFLSEEEYKEYEKINDRIFACISDEAIMTTNIYSGWQKLYLLNMKYKKNIFEECKLDEELCLTWNGNVISDLKAAQVGILDMDFENRDFLVSGLISSLVKDDMELVVRYNGEKAEVSVCEEGLPATQFPLDNDSYAFRAFDVKIPLVSEETNISFALVVDGQEYEVEKVHVSQRGVCEHVIPEEQHRCGYMIQRLEDGIVVTKE